MIINRQTHRHDCIYITLALGPHVILETDSTKFTSLSTFWTNHPSLRRESQGNYYHLFLCPGEKKNNEYSVLASGMKGNLQDWPCSSSCSKDSYSKGWGGFGLSHCPESASSLVLGVSSSGKRVTCWTSSCFLLDESECLRKLDCSSHIRLDH